MVGCNNAMSRNAIETSTSVSGNEHIFEIVDTEVILVPSKAPLYRFLCLLRCAPITPKIASVVRE
jgi:hypothetical protein